MYEKCNNEIIFVGIKDRKFKCQKLKNHNGLHTNGCYEWN
jgi:hypothetical protein